MSPRAIALVSGFVFGVGLSLAQMTNPSKVLAFLDPFGAWDPSLALVMAGAVAVAFVFYRLASRRSQPLLGGELERPGRSRIDGRLLLGAALFGVGWGLAGYCPGPAVAALAVAWREPALFVAAMALGGVAARRLEPGGHHPEGRSEHTRRAGPSDAPLA